MWRNHGIALYFLRDDALFAFTPQWRFYRGNLFQLARFSLSRSDHFLARPICHGDRKGTRDLEVKHDLASDAIATNGFWTELIATLDVANRSEERRVGKECLTQCR